MQLEDDTPAASPIGSGGMVEHLILMAETAVRYRLAIYRNRFRLTELQYRLMMHVAEQGMVSLTQLARLVNRDCAQVSRSVKGLVAAGMMSAGRQQGKVAVAIERPYQTARTVLERDQPASAQEAPAEE
jgi:hypothetical protein